MQSFAREDRISGNFYEAAPSLPWFQTCWISVRATTKLTFAVYRILPDWPARPLRLLASFPERALHVATQCLSPTVFEDQCRCRDAERALFLLVAHYDRPGRQDGEQERPANPRLHRHGRPLERRRAPGDEFCRLRGRMRRRFRARGEG